MEKTLKLKIVAGTVAAAAVAGGGAAVAASQLGSPKEESQAVVDDAAKQLGIPSAKLSDALKKALENRVDAAVAAGRMTKEQGDELKQRIESGELPLFFGGRPHGGPFEHGLRGLDAAATYLGMTEAELRTQLESGKTLAQVAKDKGKAVDGLIDAMVADAKNHLDADVAAGRLTKDDETQLLSRIREHVTDLVNGKLPPPPPGFGDRGDDRFGGDHLGWRFGPRFRGPTARPSTSFYPAA